MADLQYVQALSKGLELLWSKIGLALDLGLRWRSSFVIFTVWRLQVTDALIGRS